MAKLDYDIIEESRLFYDDVHGECWVSFRIPEGVDVGDMGATLWRGYINYLKALRADESPCEEPCLI